MSENAITVVELSLDLPRARERASAVREWLVTLGVVQPNAKRDDLWQPSEFRAGPNVLRAVTEWGPMYARLANSGVDVVSERKPYHPFENDEPPSCPTCETPMGDGDYSLERLAEWYEGSEPRVRCGSCGNEALAGVWRGRFWATRRGRPPRTVGEPASGISLTAEPAAKSPGAARPRGRRDWARE
jgi:hypothetical protein